MKCTNTRTIFGKECGGRIRRVNLAVVSTTAGTDLPSLGITIELLSRLFVLSIRVYQPHHELCARSCVVGSSSEREISAPSRKFFHQRHVLAIGASADVAVLVDSGELSLCLWRKARPLMWLTLWLRFQPWLLSCVSENRDRTGNLGSA